MEYDLTIDGLVSQTATFILEEVPAVSSQGEWLERVVIDEMFGFNPNFHDIIETHSVIDGKSIHTRVKEYLMIDTIKSNLCRTIDRATESSIIAFAGDAVTQRNKTAKSIQLVRKEVAGTITVEEKAMLDVLDAMFAQVETMIADGNAKELIVNNVNITIPELEQFIASLPIAPVV